MGDKMFKVPLLTQLAQALTNKDTNGEVESELDFDAQYHTVIGRLSPSEWGLFILLEKVKIYIDAEQMVFDRSIKHSPEEVRSKMKQAVLDEFYDRVDGLISMSLFERFYGDRTDSFVTGVLKDGTVVEISDEEVPAKMMRTMSARMQ